MILSAGLTIILCAALIAPGGSPAVADKGKEIAVLQTSLGTFEIELYRSEAPKTVENFVRLAQKKMFDGIRFHRVSRGFVIQSGDPLSADLKKKELWGSGGTSIYGGKEFVDELNASTASFKEGYKRGIVAMANRGPNTNTSQFFVMLADRPDMPKKYTIFGKVVSGMDVVDKIGAVELDPPYVSDGKPKVDVMLKKVTIKKTARPRK
jgi:cyclophilin family peptidyl-prolyl cis-trans isomerase